VDAEVCHTPSLSTELGEPYVIYNIGGSVSNPQRIYRLFHRRTIGSAF
jgi:hypothetical protein